MSEYGADAEAHKMWVLEQEKKQQHADDEYNARVTRSLYPEEIAHIAKQMTTLGNVDAWDGEIVLSLNHIILGTLWYSTDVETWCYDPSRHGEAA